MEEAAKNKVHVTVGTCNSVGAVGACIGGGMGRFRKSPLVSELAPCEELSGSMVIERWALQLSSFEHTNFWAIYPAPFVPMKNKS